MYSHPKHALLTDYATEHTSKHYRMLPKEARSIMSVNVLTLDAHSWVITKCALLLYKYNKYIIILLCESIVFALKSR